MIFQVDKETMPREELKTLQLGRLQNLCARVYATIPFYKKKFTDLGVLPSDIRSLSDLTKLPFTEKQDMRDNFPFGLFAVPREQIVRIHASSGTTGKATVTGYTRRDLDNWSDMMARSLAMAGCNSNDMIHNAYGYGLFTGGLGMHYGAERLGATVIPVSGGATNRQVELLRDFGATAIAGTPSYMLYLNETANELGVSIKDLPLKIGVFGAEPWSEEMRREIEEKTGIDALNIYGLSEIMGPGVAMECVHAKHGMHLQEDHFLCEIIDPITLQQLPMGETGELVITTLTKEGSPLIRYRTHDITHLIEEPCICGRTFLRLGRITGRSDEMLIIRGVNLFPSQIESILIETDGLSPHYQLVVDRVDNLDTVEVQVEVSEEMFSDAIKDLQRKEKLIQNKIKDFLGISCKVRFVNPRAIARSEGKAKRVIDNRKK